MVTHASQAIGLAVRQYGWTHRGIADDMVVLTHRENDGLLLIRCTDSGNLDPDAAQRILHKIKNP